MKFQRDYRLTIKPGDSALPGVIDPGNAQALEDASDIEISYPLTIDINISRNTLGSTNTAQFNLYNLSAKTRARIFKDRYDILNYRPIILEAGYRSEGTLPIIFRGSLRVAGSQRRGSDWVTTIECWDGGEAMATAQASLTAPAGTSARTLITSIVKGMPNLTMGAVGNIENQTARGTTLVGNAWDAVQRVSGSADAFVDGERVNVLANDEYANPPGVIPVITSASGLLNTPRRQEKSIDVDILFEPRVAVGQLVQVQSLESVNDGIYKVMGFTHAGRISGAFDGGLKTTLNLWRGTSRLREVLSPGIGVPA